MPDEVSSPSAGAGSPAGRITRDFYQEVGAGGGLSAEAAAPALHGAVHRARRRMPDHPSVWAAHVHVGV